MRKVLRNRMSNCRLRPRAYRDSCKTLTKEESIFIELRDTGLNS